MTPRGGSPQEVGDVLARARRNAGVAEPPRLDDSSSPPAPATVPVHAPKYCSSCSAPILWAQLLDEAGERQRKPDGRFKAVPVNFDPAPDGNVVVLHRPGQGIVARVLKRGEAPPPGARLRRSHFFTCPNAEQHRRSR